MSADLSSLLDIRQAIGLALGFAKDLDYDQFLRDERTTWAIYSQIIIIGEAANRISRDFQQANPNIPWRQIVSMRHRLIHGYDEINWLRVWETVTGDLPKLKKELASLIPQEPRD